MIFKFLSYLQPTHYFLLKRKNKSFIFPEISSLNSEALNEVPLDSAYTSKTASDYDQSWRLIQKGYVGEANTYQNFEAVPVVDNYRFIRKNFNPIWVFYVLLIRLLSLKNPLVEVSSFLKTRQVKQVDEHQSPFKYNTYENFESDLIQKNPLVSVIIPTLNRYEYLKDVLKDLEGQDYKNFEVIVVDQSEPYKEDFYAAFNLELKVSYQEEKALWLARNNAIKSAQGEYILLFDDDSRVDPNWISQHLKTLDFFKADLSSGVSISSVGAKVPASYAHFGVSSQLDTGNVLLKKSVFKDLGLFDRQFEKQRMGDGEFGLRAFLAGYTNISNPFAMRLHLKVGSGGLREMGSWDGFRPKKWLDPRPIPSVVYLFRKYYGEKATRLALLKTVPSSIMPYKYKRNSYLMLIGVVISFFLLPVIFIQVNRSWRLASRKLIEGSKIEKL